jgi:hypothetical protein
MKWIFTQRKSRAKVLKRGLHEKESWIMPGLGVRVRVRVRVKVKIRF